MKKSLGVGRAARAGHAGFTLIELLTVIAIISVLAGLTAVAVPRYLENARIVQAETNAKAVVNALAAKSTEVGNTTGYPAAYGFIRSEARDLTPAEMSAAPREAVFVTRPYTAEIGLHGVAESYELARWTQAAYDSNNDGSLGLLEFLPVGNFDAGGNTYRFSTDLYAGPGGEFSLGIGNPAIGGVSERDAQLLTGTQRPLVYVPFNSRQLNAVRRYWLDRTPENTRDFYGEEINFGSPALEGRIFFPPPSYDGFVLIGNGPGGDNGGVVVGPPTTITDPNGIYSDVYAYHLAALRTAFLATRDLDPDGGDGAAQPDGLLDFDFRARKSNGTFRLPPGAPNPNGYGAFITVVQ